MVGTKGFFRSAVLLNPRRGYSVVDATILRQIGYYGRPNQHLLPGANRSSRVCRVASFGESLYEERDGGVYLEVKAVVLSRDIPASLLAEHKGLN